MNFLLTNQHSLMGLGLIVGAGRQVEEAALSGRGGNEGEERTIHLSEIGRLAFGSHTACGRAWVWYAGKGVGGGA